jgi:hypothetical protein
MMKRAVDTGKFKGYQVSASIQFQLLQFADDTILMGEGSWRIYGPLKVYFEALNWCLVLK